MVSPKQHEEISRWAEEKRLDPEQLRQHTLNKWWGGSGARSVISNYQKTYAEKHPRAAWTLSYREDLEIRARARRARRIRVRREKAAEKYAMQERRRQRSFERSIRKGRR
jgi:hypothetical protein